MEESLQNALDQLLRSYGSHCEATRAIGIDPGHYRKMRNERVDIPQRIADYITLKESEVKNLIAMNGGGECS